jgi:predicted secreted protein
MTRNAAPKGLARLGVLWASLGLALLLLVAPVLAGDRAQIDLIGYSPGGSYFAFEEFGIQDGSGFAYSSIYVVDLTEDSWVVGTPIRVQAAEETIPLTEIRAEAHAKAANDIATLGIDVPGQFVAMIGDGVPEDDGQTLSFGRPGFGAGEVIGTHRLELRDYGTQSATPCMEWFGSAPRGYQLSIVDDQGERLVHKDTSLPRSRGCPVDYRLFGVVVPFEIDPTGHAVAIISVYTYGFEGPDRRFIVVPLGL